jgi:propanol-preferring alcohol dehydrogenase
VHCQNGKKTKDERQRMNRIYKAVQVTQAGKLEPVERAIVEPAFGRVRIRVEACGVCHTDARGPEKESLARKLGAHHYIDSNAQDPVAALQTLGGARLILATAANSKSMSPLLGGLAPRGQLIVAGAGGSEPIAVDPVLLLFGMRSIAGTMTGSSIDAEDTLSFSSRQGIRPMIETVPLANAAEAYGRMMRNEARFRIVLVTGHS